MKVQFTKKKQIYKEVEISQVILGKNNGTNFLNVVSEFSSF